MAITGVASLCLLPFIALNVYDEIKPLGPASVACLDGNRPPSSLIIIGDSWAAKGRLLAGAAQARRGGRERICSIGFSGHTTREIEERIASVDVAAIAGGSPAHIVILTGVNDLAQNRPADEYVQSVRGIMSKFPAAEPHVILPIVDVETKAAPLNRLRRSISALTGKTSRADMAAALEAAFPADVIIPYDQFSAGARAEPHRYADDRVHLTDPEYRKLGAFIGANIGG